MLFIAINSVAICRVATKNLFKEDLQNCNSDFINFNKFFLAFSLSFSPIGKLTKQIKASTAN